MSIRFTPASSAAWMVRIDCSSGGRPRSDIGIAPRPMGNTSVLAISRLKIPRAPRSRGRCRRAGPGSAGGAACRPVSTPRYPTRATSTGSTKRVSFGGWRPSNGLSSRSRSASMAPSRFSSRSSKPVPTCPAYTSRPSLWTPTTSAPNWVERRPSPGSQPPITTSASRTFLTLTQPCARLPGVYGQSSRLAMIPSSPFARDASSIAAPSPTWWVGVCQRSSPRRLEQPLAPLGVGEVDQRVAVEPQQVEDDVVDRGRSASSRRTWSLGRQVHAALELLEARPAVLERDDLAVEDGLAAAQRPGEAAELGIARRDVAPAAGLELDAPAADVGDRAHAVPLDLVRPVLVVPGQLAGAWPASARVRSGMGSRSGSSGGSMRWIIQSWPSVLEQDVLPVARARRGR